MSSWSWEPPLRPTYAAGELPTGPGPEPLPAAAAPAKSDHQRDLEQAVQDPHRHMGDPPATPEPAPRVNPTPWLPETREELLELHRLARDQHQGARIALGTASDAYQRARASGAEPLELFQLRIARGLAADAARTWALELDGLVDVLSALGIDT